MFHRVIKQVCNIERFYVRDKQAIQNHFFFALRAFAKLQTLRINDLIDNLYQISRELFIPHSAAQSRKKDSSFVLPHIPQLRAEKKIVHLYYFFLRRFIVDFNNFIKNPV